MKDETGNNDANPDTENEDMEDKTGNHNANPDTENEEMIDLSRDNNVNSNSNPQNALNNDAIDSGADEITIPDPDEQPQPADVNPANNQPNAPSIPPNLEGPAGIKDTANQPLYFVDLDDYIAEDDEDYDPDKREHQLEDMPINIFENDNQNDDEEDNGDEGVVHQNSVLGLGIGIYSAQFGRYNLEKIWKQSGASWKVSEAIKGTMAKTLGYNDVHIDFRFHEGPRRKRYRFIYIYLVYEQCTCDCFMLYTQKL